MKKKITMILLIIALLAGCEAAPATAQEDTPDINAIVQQSVEKAIAQYEEAQKEKDTEIAGLKAQLEELTSQAEEIPDVAEPPEIVPAEEIPAPVSRQPEEPESQPEPEPEEPAPTQSSAPSSRYDGFDLKNLYPAYIWENFQPIEGDQNSDNVWVLEYEDEEESQNTSGFLREDDAWMVTQLINQEREAYGLDALPVDDNLMELAAVRAKELWDLYDHTRPDGTRVSEQRCGENIGRRDSAAEQVQSWMNSEGHRKNNLSERYHHIGAGCYQAANGNLYWVAIFSLD